MNVKQTSNKTITSKTEKKTHIYWVTDERMLQDV